MSKIMEACTTEARRFQQAAENTLMKIIRVEDSARLIAKDPFGADVADSAAGALTLAHTHHYHALIVDLIMPGVTRFKFVEQLAHI